MIIKVSFVIIDGAHWEQYVGMLVWLGVFFLVHQCMVVQLSVSYGNLNFL